MESFQSDSQQQQLMWGLKRTCVSDKGALRAEGWGRDTKAVVARGPAKSIQVCRRIG